MSEPKSLQEAILYFSEPKNCREYMIARRWVNGVECPRCGSKNALFMEKYNRWHCREKHDAPQFTLKTGTVMEDSPIGLDKWLTSSGIWMSRPIAFNQRHMTDAEEFDIAVNGIVGKRLTFEQLTGKQPDSATL